MLTELLAAVAMAGTGLEAYNSPRWTVLPTADDIAAVYPRHAALSGISGNAIVKCRGGAEGRLEDCEVFAETPNQEGFGAAALRLTSKFRFGTAVPLPPGVRPSLWIPIRFTQNSLHPDPNRMVIYSPTWARAPMFEDLALAFPAAAKVASAVVILRCPVEADRGLGACETREERPNGQGFADAARALAGKFRLDPEQSRVSLDSLAVDIRFHFLDPRAADFQRRTVIEPSWLTLPDPAVARALFPATAAAKGVKTGQGVVSCTVAIDGRLRDCAPRAGNPDGLGFSEAAMKVAATMRMNPWTSDGGPVDGARLTLPIRFDITPDKPPATTRTQ